MEKEKVIAWLHKLAVARKCMVRNRFFDKEEGYDGFCTCEGGDAKIQLYNCVPEICKILGVEPVIVPYSIYQFGDVERSFVFDDVRFYDIGRDPRHE